MKKNNFLDLKTFNIITLGCKVNNYESNVIQNDLLSYGLIKVPFDEPADLSIINTCSVTNTADAKSRNMIRRSIQLNPNGIILVCGCYSQVSSQDLKKDYGIDILIGNKYKNNIAQLIDEYFIQQNKQLIKVDNLLLEKDFENSKIDIYREKTRAFVKIQDGCNYMCSYCIIPFTRGRQRSKDFYQLINEIITLVKNGYKEIVLTGVNTAGYISKDKNFYDLLKEINNLSGDFRIRISSIEPFQINDDIINLICLHPKRFCQHLHICLQSGSDDVLKQMNRKYNTNEFRNLINKLYYLNPYIAITTDYICGFPTESNKDHNESLKFVKEIGFYKLHVFPYSKRKYTPAANLIQVKDINKKQRVNDMLELSNKLSRNFIKKFIGREVDVLFEECYGEINIGHSSEYFKVQVFSKNNLTTKLKKVIITKVFLDQAYGELVE